MILWRRLSLWVVLFALPVVATAAVPTPAGPIQEAAGHPAELYLDRDVFFAPGGDYVRLIWEIDPESSFGELFGQRFAADGTPREDRFTVDPDLRFLPISAFSRRGLQQGVFLSDDSFAVVWAATPVGRAASRLYFRTFDGNGSPRTDVVEVAEVDFIDFLHAVALGENHVAFTADGDRTSAQVAHALYWVFDADGNGSAERRVGGAASPSPSCGFFVTERPLGIERLPDGDFVIVFERPFTDEELCPELGVGVFSRRFGPGGDPRGDEMPFTGNEAEFPRAVAWIPAEEAFLLTSLAFPGGPGRDVEAQWFNLDGQALAPAFKVARIFSGEVSSSISAQTPAGDILVGWFDSALFRPGDTYQLRALEEDCTPGLTTLCQGGGRFRVDVDWRDFRDREGSGNATPLSHETGYFTFFNGDNVELVVKVLDGQPRNGNFWVFYGALSNVRYRLSVTDTERGIQQVYDNPAQTFASTGDTAAFPGDGGSGAAPIQAGNLKPAEIAALLPGIPTDGPGLATAGESTGELSFHGGRFRASTTWRDFLDRSGTGQGAMLTEDTGYFWFFRPENVEVVVKVLDGRANNGHWWVFYGALSNVEYTLTVEDTENGTSKEYFNPLRTFASDGDTTAFPD